MKTIKFTVSVKRPEKSLIKLLKQYKELEKQGVTRVHLVAKNELGYYTVEWLSLYKGEPRPFIKGIESILDGMFLSRILTYSQCHKVDMAIRELWS